MMKRPDQRGGERRPPTAGGGRGGRQGGPMTPPPAGPRAGERRPMGGGEAGPSQGRMTERPGAPRGGVQGPSARPREMILRRLQERREMMRPQFQRDDHERQGPRPPARRSGFRGA